MGYFLGVDIGTTYTAAAVWRDGRGDVANLGNRAASIPSVVLLRDDGTVLVGEAAVRRAATEPGRVAREFKRRVGDPTPIIVGGTPYSADSLMARLLRAVVDQVVQAEGGPPDGIAVTHPANWGPYKLDLLRQAVRLADLDDVVTVSEPEAAAIHYASQARVEPGSTIAVYDLGGGTFDAAVLRKTDAGWDVLGTPEGIERLGGVDFDAAVQHHVATAVGTAVDDLSPDDPAAVAAAARLRQECVDAKEALSSDSDVSIPVLLPGLQTEVRLTRAEYEQMVRPALADTITAMTRALRSAGVEPGEVTTVLLVGGSSRTPLVAELVSTALRRPVAVDAHPKYGVALGAALTAAQRGGRDGRATASGADDPAAAGAPGAGAAPGAATAAVAATAAAVISRTGEASTPDRPTHDEQVPTPAPAATRVAAPADGPGPAAPTPAVPAPERDLPPHGAEPAPTVVRPAATPAGGPAGDPAARATGAPTRDTRSVTVPYGVSAADGASPSRGADAPGAPRAASFAGAGSGGSRDDDGAPVRRTSESPGRSGARRGVLAAAAAAAVLVVAVGAFLALSGDDGGGGADGDGDAASTSDAGASEAPAAAGDDGGSTAAGTDGGSEAAAPTGPFVEIHDVTVQDGRYLVEYEVSNYTPQLDAPPDALHVHFFLDTTERDNAGSNGDPPGTWNLTDEPTSFLTEFTPEGSGGATQLCAAVADVHHGVFQRGGDDTGNCVALPS